MTDYGDLELPNTSLEAMRSAMMPLVTPLVRDHHMIWLGGDHSVTLPLLRAYKQVLGHPVAVLHFDAHCDTWKDHFGEPSGHGTWVYEAVQEKLVDPRCFFQFGIRSSGERNAREYVNDQGGMVFTARMLRGKDGAEGMKPVVEKVLQRLREHGNPKVYVTFDIDCLDPSFAPGTGTPEPGGLSSSQALSLLEAFCAMIPDQMIGFDVMEVAPVYDNAELTTSAAATLAWTYMSAQVALQNRGIEELKKMYAVGNALPQ
jgi:agmatinase